MTSLDMSSVTALGNNNFVIASMYDDDGASVTDAGSVMLINGATGVQIGTTLAGNAAYDQLGQSSVTALGNNNFVIASRFDDDGTVSPSVVNAGSVMLINGATGVQIGTTLVGNRENDCLGMSSVTALGNNNFVIASSSDDDGTTTVDAGSVMLINGATGVQIGTTLAGDTAYDILGSSSVTALGNNNFVIGGTLINLSENPLTQKANYGPPALRLVQHWWVILRLTTLEAPALPPLATTTL